MSYIKKMGHKVQFQEKKKRGEVASYSQSAHQVCAQHQKPQKIPLTHKGKLWDHNVGHIASGHSKYTSYLWSKGTKKLTNIWWIHLYFSRPNLLFFVTSSLFIEWLYISQVKSALVLCVCFIVLMRLLSRNKNNTHLKWHLSTPSHSPPTKKKQTGKVKGYG